jgi:lysyl-tRNA synthetase class II
MRYRSVAMVLDLQLRWRVAARARFIQVLREAMWRRGFVEIPTPVLQPIYGGASRHASAFRGSPKSHRPRTDHLDVSR